MKRTVSVLVALLLCVLMMGEAFASELPVEQAEVDYGPWDVAAYLDRSVEEFKAFTEGSGKAFSAGSMSTSTVENENGEMVSVVSGFSFRESGFSIYGYAVDGRHDHTVQETMEAQGWTCTYKSFEGGLRWFEFEKTENGMLYVFELDSCDSVITYVSLSRSPVEAVAAE